MELFCWHYWLCATIIHSAEQHINQEARFLCHAQHTRIECCWKATTRQVKSPTMQLILSYNMNFNPYSLDSKTSETTNISHLDIILFSRYKFTNITVIVSITSFSSHEKSNTIRIMATSHCKKPNKFPLQHFMDTWENVLPFVERNEIKNKQNSCTDAPSRQVKISCSVENLKCNKLKNVSHHLNNKAKISHLNTRSLYPKSHLNHCAILELSNMAMVLNHFWKWK